MIPMASCTCRQVAELYALGLAYTPRLGPTTDTAVTKMAAVFTQVGICRSTGSWLCLIYVRSSAGMAGCRLQN